MTTSMYRISLTGCAVNFQWYSQLLRMSILTNQNTTALALVLAFRSCHNYKCSHYIFVTITTASVSTRNPVPTHDIISICCYSLYCYGRYNKVCAPPLGSQSASSCSVCDQFSLLTFRGVQFSSIVCSLSLFADHKTYIGNILKRCHVLLHVPIIIRSIVRL